MTPEPIGLIFPGQGTQRQGMGEPWRHTKSWPLVADISGWTGLDVEELLLKADDERLRRTDLAQVAIFTVAVLAYTEMSSRRPVRVAAYAGHSLGEYVALAAAGALALRDAAVLVATRGRAMRAAAAERPGTMAVLVGADLEAASALTEEARAAGHDVWVANINAAQQVVISGTVSGVGHAAELAVARGVRAIRIPVDGAFHSPLMAPAMERLREALLAVRFAGQHGVVVANVDARPYSGDCDWVDLETRQLTSPVRWEQSVRVLTAELGCRRLIELGPGRTLAGMVRRISPATDVVSVDTPDALCALEG